MTNDKSQIAGDQPQIEVPALSSVICDLSSERRYAFFGGVYSNYLALESLLEDAGRRDIDRLYCLGDLGAFGPFPDRVCHLLRETDAEVIQGNYDNSIGNGLADCQCGYTDPRDNYFAKLSYDYTFVNTSDENKAWMRRLPQTLRLTIGRYRLLLCHGSPRKMNEFLWETTTSDAFLAWLFRTYQTDLIVATHTGLHWSREVPVSVLENSETDPSESASTQTQTQTLNSFINCGAIGRPPNNGRTSVIYAIVSFPAASVEFVELEYDHERLAAEMRAEGLPEEFVETILTGWWTTCNEILPGKERARGKY
jgi:diadenosine tetraphosphatase ApaH/serine/threonine PP2A family protein phosphatase